MEVKASLLCDSATTHPDGTFSLLRGGINNWNIKTFPAHVSFSFIIVIELMAEEVEKEHLAELDIIDDDGKKLLPRRQMVFKINKKEDILKYKYNLIGGINVKIDKEGKYSLHFFVDGNALTSLDFQVRPLVKK